jgi:hypothetical protein
MWLFGDGIAGLEFPRIKVMVLNGADLCGLWTMDPVYPRIAVQWNERQKVYA